MGQRHYSTVKLIWHSSAGLTLKSQIANSKSQLLYPSHHYYYVFFYQNYMSSK